MTLTNGSPRAVDISAMDFRVRFGKPEVHLEMAASDRPIFLARSDIFAYFPIGHGDFAVEVNSDGKFSSGD